MSMMQLPARIGKYELQEFLGGGMARVYRATDTVIGRTVAVKILTEEGCADEEVKSRFLQEAQLAGNVSHDNIISIYDFGQDEQGRPFMVMEFLKGEDLRRAIKNGTAGDTRNKLRIALGLGRALEHIHTQKIIHRDIKPDNVHITTAGVVKLMDFGISKMQNSTRTTTGVVMGTPYYMAPEQVLGKNVTELVDVYSFGVLLFELMTGTRPVTGDTVERIFYQILEEPLNVEPMRAAGVPDAVIDLAVRCTQKDPAMRPQGFGEVCSRIEQILQNWEMPTQALPAAVRPAVSTVGASAAAAAPAPEVISEAPSGKGWLAPAIVVGLLVVLLAGYFAMQAIRKPQAESVATVLPPKAATAKSIETPTGRMVLVPAGEFLFGKDKQSVKLPDYYIDQTEVPYQAYAQFCAAKGRPVPPGAEGERPEDPIVDVSFLDAQEFAKWAGKRLPTAQEWEKAARGADGRLYPWGEAQTPAPANVGNRKGMMQVHSFPEGASPYGALNMVGNVWEWVDESRVPSAGAIANLAKAMQPAPTAAEPWFVIRGGSFAEPISDAYLWDSATVPARRHAKNIGFRCVKNP
ncbi:MAG TPA: bifunctional serine/threonine-protein kinase/formylglycine-generating enzyme family protein [Bryobacteraceae bacterium]|nr:bifunctional serine/threonine-protein kinase/formylglycine-generating enzyme family protein [Bryobacteraceae bacterium]